ERVLSPRALNRALLARQLLLQPAALDPARALERTCGLQTQYAPAAYVALFSRLAGFTRADLTGALNRRRVVQGWVMRSTIHMVSARDYGTFTAAVRAVRRAQWLRADKQAASSEMEAVMEAAATTVRAFLADGPRKQAEIQRHLADAGFPAAAWRGAQLWLDLVRVPPAGTWELPRAHVYGLAAQWVPGPEPEEGEARVRLVERYLRGFGPASAKDVASFCGFTVGQARAALAGLGLRRFRDESGGELLDLPRAPLPEPGTPAPVRFLEQWDAVLLVHARRARVLPEEHRPKVFATSMPQSVPTFLVDGQVAGTWRFEAGRVVVSPFAGLPGPARREVDAEAERLAAFAS
ncbi:MAG TPA: winged helix DNA-binding domain-containing protein, partial [Pseudonocardia sp.]|nr:winged helix DNA-binding domain-containing protein [Pseudonocardia sp.]